MRYTVCCICGRYITYQFWVCRACEERWNLIGVDYRDWPLWVKALKNFEQCERNRVLRRSTLDIQEVGFEEEPQTGGDL